MGQKESFLSEICHKEFGFGNHPKPNSFEIFSSKYKKEIYDAYKKLGGILEKPPSSVGKYDIDLEDFIIELDEANHFNRYRKITVDSVFYTKNNILDVRKYKLFCNSHEAKCCTHGRYWSTISSDKQFGKSSVNGSFEGGGSSRFKQRAFYDFVKDVNSAINGIPLMRISIYDIYNSSTIESLIYKKALLTD